MNVDFVWHLIHPYIQKFHVFHFVLWLWTTQRSLWLYFSNCFFLFRRNFPKTALHWDNHVSFASTLFGCYHSSQWIVSMALDIPFKSRKRARAYICVSHSILSLCSHFRTALSSKQQQKKTGWWCEIFSSKSFVMRGCSQFILLPPRWYHAKTFKLENRKYLFSFALFLSLYTLQMKSIQFELFRISCAIYFRTFVLLQIYKAADICRLCWRWAALGLGRILWPDNRQILHQSFWP